MLGPACQTLCSRMVIQFHCLRLQKIEDTYIILFDDHISFPTRLHVQNSIPEERNEHFLTLICYFLSDWHADGSIGEFLDYGHVDNVWKENPYGVDESGGQRKDLLRVFRRCHGDDEQW